MANDRILKSNLASGDLEIFYLAATHGSLRGACGPLAISYDTVRRRIDRLEAEFGQKLFVRETDGVSLTAYGEQLFEHAKNLWDALETVKRLSRRSSEEGTGLISLQVPEGLGSFWVFPRLHNFMESYPSLTLQTDLTGPMNSVRDRGYDVTIQYKCPENTEKICRKLGSMHVLLYTGRNFEVANGKPTTIQDLRNYRLIHQSSETFDEMALMRMLGHEQPSKPIAHLVDSSIAAFQLIRTSHTIAAFPTYVSALTNQIIPLHVSGVQSKLDIWLTYQRDVKSSKPGMDLIQWLMECFDSTKFPFFGDEYVSPEEISDFDRSLWAANSLDYVIGDEGV
ncbi:MAG: LysR family transcriptional regulator [Pseudomonadota bacterium]